MLSEVCIHVALKDMLSGELGSVTLMAGLNDLKGLF